MLVREPEITSLPTVPAPSLLVAAGQRDEDTGPARRSASPLQAAPGLVGGQDPRPEGTRGWQQSCLVTWEGLQGCLC